MAKILVLTQRADDPKPLFEEPTDTFGWPFNDVTMFENRSSRFMRVGSP